MSHQATMIDSSLMIARSNSRNIARVNLLQQATHLIPLTELPMFPVTNLVTLARSLAADSDHSQGHLSRSFLAVLNLKPQSYSAKTRVNAMSKD
jgi:transcriptional regulator GlxA family with amidase domain